MSIEILLNGKREVLQNEMCIADLLRKKNIRPEVVTVELNEKIIDRENYQSTVLKEGDTLEFVFFMGGGSTWTSGERCATRPKIELGAGLTTERRR